MATVPRYSDQQVAPTGLPNVRISDSGATPEAFGAGIGRGLADFSQVATQIAEREREKADTAALMEAQKAFSDLDLELLNDPEKGALAKQGKDAIGIHETVLPEWDRRASEIIGRAPARVQARAQQYAMQRRETAAERLMSHSLQQGDRYYAERADSTIKLFQSEAIANRMDPAAVDKAAEQAMQAAEEAGRLRGLSDEGRALLRSSAASTAYRGVIEALAVDDPLAAEERYAKVRGFIRPEDQLEIDKALRPLAQDREDEADLQRDLAGIGAPRTIYTGPVTQVKADTRLQSVPLEQRRALPYNAPELDAYAAYVEQQYDLPAGLINALKNAGEKSNSGQVSGKGARGVMQFMPENLRKYGVTDPTDPVQMIEAAGKYLRDTMRQYGGNVDAVIADYNGGPKQAAAVRAGREPAAEETRAYLHRVKAALGAVDTGGSSQAVTVKPPASEVEHLRLIDEKYRDNPVKRERMRRRASREWAMRNAEKAERDRSMGEAIYTKIYSADPRRPLASILSKEERDWAIKEGRFDAFDAELTRRAAGNEQVSDPDVLYGLEQSFYRAAKGSPAAQAGLRAINPYDPSLPLSRSDRARLANAQLSLLSDDEKKRAATAQDWMTEEQRVASGVLALGLTDPVQKGRFGMAYRQAVQAHVLDFGEKPRGDVADKLLRKVQLNFAESLRSGTTKKYEAAEAYGPVLSRAVANGDYVTAENLLRQRYNRAPTKAEVIAHLDNYYRAQKHAD